MCVESNAIVTDWQKIARLRAQLEVTAPAAGPSSEEWGAAQELAEVEKLAEMGIVVDPSAGSKRSKGKGKARDVPLNGHVVFAEDRTECESCVRWHVANV